MLPYLPTALEVLMHVSADCQDMIDVVALLNQLMLRYKNSLQDLLKEVGTRQNDPTRYVWMCEAVRSTCLIHATVI